MDYYESLNKRQKKTRSIYNNQDVQSVTQSYMQLDRYQELDEIGKQSAQKMFDVGYFKQSLINNDVQTEEYGSIKLEVDMLKKEAQASQGPDVTLSRKMSRADLSNYLNYLAQKKKEAIFDISSSHYEKKLSDLKDEQERLRTDLDKSEYKSDVDTLMGKVSSDQLSLTRELVQESMLDERSIHIKLALRAENEGKFDMDVARMKLIPGRSKSYQRLENALEVLQEHLLGKTAGLLSGDEAYSDASTLLFCQRALDVVNEYIGAHSFRFGEAAERKELVRTIGSDIQGMMAQIQTDVRESAESVKKSKAREKQLSEKHFEMVGEELGEVFSDEDYRLREERLQREYDEESRKRDEEEEKRRIREARERSFSSKAIRVMDSFMGLLGYVSGYASGKALEKTFEDAFDRVKAILKNEDEKVGDDILERLEGIFSGAWELFDVGEYYLGVRRVFELLGEFQGQIDALNITGLKKALTDFREDVVRGLKGLGHELTSFDAKAKKQYGLYAKSGAFEKELGPVRLGVKGSVELLNTEVKARATGQIYGKEGFSPELEAKAQLRATGAKAEAKTSLKVGKAHAKAKGSVTIGEVVLAGELGLSLYDKEGKFSPKVKAGSSVGAKLAEVGGSFSIAYGDKTLIEVKGSAGVGAVAGIKFNYDNGKLTVGAELAVILGLSGEVTIDIKDFADTLWTDIRKGLGDTAEELREQFNEKVVNALFGYFAELNGVKVVSNAYRDALRKLEEFEDLAEDERKKYERANPVKIMNGVQVGSSHQRDKSIVTATKAVFRLITG